jgi:hypothetical protein
VPSGEIQAIEPPPAPTVHDVDHRDLRRVVPDRPPRSVERRLAAEHDDTSVDGAAAVAGEQRSKPPGWR